MNAQGKTGLFEELLIAPDSFKGTFTSVQVGELIAAGARAAGTPARVMPAADGGEGTLAALTEPLELKLTTVTVSGPLGAPVQAQFGLGEDGTAVVETAAASGLNLVPEAERDALRASTAGTGELIVRAVEAGARHVLVAVGGSASTDGGSGAVAAISAAAPDGLAQTRFTVICDVRTPFERAAEIFAPQKGADRDQVRELTERLQHQAAAYPRDPSGVAMTGAAGGLAGGLWAAFGAELVAGAPFVLNAIGYDAAMRGALAVITGEGRLDHQSLMGKLISEVATRARQAGVPCHAVVGQAQLDAFDARILDLQLIVEASDADQLQAAGGQIADAIAADRARGQ